MPKFEDLPYLKEKIASIADETEVMKRKGRTPNLVKLPQEEKLEPSESYDELLSDDLLDDILGEDDLMSSVAKEKERSRNLEEAMEQSEQKVVKPEGDLILKLSLKIMKVIISRKYLQMIPSRKAESSIFCHHWMICLQMIRNLKTIRYLLTMKIRM